MDKLKESLTYIKCGTFSTMNMGFSGLCTMGYANLITSYNLSDIDTGIAFILTGASIITAVGSYLLRNECFDKSKSSFKSYFLEKQNANSRIPREDLEKFLND